MTFYKEAKVSQTYKAKHAGTYRLTVDIEVDGNFDPEPGKCRFRFAADDRELIERRVRLARQPVVQVRVYPDLAGRRPSPGF